MRHPEGPVQVGVDDAAELIRRLREGRPGLAHPGVVHQAVNLPELGQGEVHERRAVLRLGDVSRPGAHVDALGRQVTCHVLESRGPASRDDDPAAGPAHRAGEADAQSGGRAGDDDDLAIEAECLQGIHCDLRDQRARPAAARTSVPTAASPCDSALLDHRTVKDHDAT